MNDRTANPEPLPDPYIYHRDGMVSTWIFDDYAGKIGPEICLILVEALALHIDFHGGSRNPLPVRLTWREQILKLFTPGPSGDQETELTVRAKWGLRWGMLEEGCVADESRGLERACWGGKGFDGTISARGKEVGYVTMRRRHVDQQEAPVSTFNNTGTLQVSTDVTATRSDAKD